MVKKAKSETDEKRKHDETDEELERELEDSVPSERSAVGDPAERGRRA